MNGTSEVGKSSDDLFDAHSTAGGRLTLQQFSKFSASLPGESLTEEGHQMNNVSFVLPFLARRALFRCDPSVAKHEHDS